MASPVSAADACRAGAMCMPIANSRLNVAVMMLDVRPHNIVRLLEASFFLGPPFLTRRPRKLSSIDQSQKLRDESAVRRRRRARRPAKLLRIWPQFRRLLAPIDSQPQAGARSMSDSAVATPGGTAEGGNPDYEIQDCRARGAIGLAADTAAARFRAKWRGPAQA